jgi:hypothetical protein
MADLLRVLLRATTILVVAMTGWLVAVIIGVLPQRDPGSIGLWLMVAAGAGALAAAALIATMRHDRPGGGLLGALLVLSVCAVAFGLFVLTTEALPSGGGHSEGYPLLIGLILATEGALGLAWLGSVRGSVR